MKKTNGPSNIVVEWTMKSAELQELVMIYTYWVGNLGAEESPYDVLVAEHLKDMFFRLVMLERKIENRARLAFNNSEARAFYEFWMTTDTSPWPLANVIICKMLEKIDKCIKVPKMAV